jgi:hypothetical protein
MIGHRVPHCGLGWEMPEDGCLRYADLDRDRTGGHPVWPDLARSRIVATISALRRSDVLRTGSVQ